MTTPERSFMHYWRYGPTRRWLLVGLMLLLLLVMAWFSLTDPLHLEHAHVLAGADWLGYAVCHRITARSFVINGRQFPLCARCTGMYLGVAVALLTFFLVGRLRRGDLPRLPLLLVLLGFLGAMGVDGLNSYSHFFPDAPHLYTPRNWLRLLTGMGTGLAMGSFVLPALAQSVWREPVYQPILGSWRELLGLLLAAGVTILLVLSNQPALLYVLALVSTGGLVLILAAINVVLGLILLRRDGCATSWGETAVPLAIGIVMALVELSLISLVRFSLTGTMTGFPGM